MDAGNVGPLQEVLEVTRDALRFAAARLALPITPELEVRLMNQYASLSAFPENLAALRELKAAGLPLGILSNGNREMIEASVRSAGMTGLFDQSLSSQDVSFKTIERIYGVGPAAFGCGARQILFVSSNCWTQSPRAGTATPASGSTAPARRSSNSTPHPITSAAC